MGWGENWNTALGARASRWRQQVDVFWWYVNQDGQIIARNIRASADAPQVYRAFQTQAKLNTVAEETSRFDRRAKDILAPVHVSS